MARRKQPRRERRTSRRQRSDPGPRRRRRTRRSLTLRPSCYRGGCDRGAADTGSGCSGTPRLTLNRHPGNCRYVACGCRGARSTAASGVDPRWLTVTELDRFNVLHDTAGSAAAKCSNHTDLDRPSKTGEHRLTSHDDPHRPVCP